MILSNALLERLSIPSPLYSTITRLRISVTFLQDRMAHRVGTEMKELVSQISPLLQAGFLAKDDFELARGTTLTLETNATGYVLVVRDMAQQSLLIWVLLALVEAVSTTPDGAYERLLSLLDGDEEMARQAFSPKSVEDIQSVILRIEGHGTEGALDLNAAPVANDIAVLAEQIEDHAPNVVITLPVDATLPDDVENGFMVLENAGVFQTAGKTTELEEPEIFITASRKLMLSDWHGSGVGPAELARVLTGGTLQGVVVSRAG